MFKNFQQSLSQNFYGSWLPMKKKEKNFEFQFIYFSIQNLPHIQK
jgi:hypothetical protein